MNLNIKFDMVLKSLEMLMEMISWTCNEWQNMLYIKCELIWNFEIYLKLNMDTWVLNWIWMAMDIEFT